MSNHFKEIIRQNNEDEYSHLRSFMKTEGWNLIPKPEKEAISKRITFLEKELGCGKESKRTTKA